MTDTSSIKPAVMFGGLTLEKQREHEVARGWKPNYAALTYCTAEVVPFRNTGDPRNPEILVSTRVTGATDCVGIQQVKYGTYSKPTDPSARHAIAREMRDMFSLYLDPEQFQFAGIVSQWLYKSTIIYDDGDMVLEVSDVQAEETPFQATLFHVNLTGLEIGQGPRHKAIKDVMWVTLRDFVNERGSDNSWAYAQMLFMAMRRRVLGNYLEPEDMLQQYAANGKYGLTVSD